VVPPVQLEHLGFRLWHPKLQVPIRNFICSSGVLDAASETSVVAFEFSFVEGTNTSGAAAFAFGTAKTLR
jgi:hypothetical protein